MFHPGKVMKVYSHQDKAIHSCDQSTQVYLEMWDENQMTLAVDPKISEKIKEGDFVLVDYSSISSHYPIPRHTVVKVLSQDMGKELWKDYKDYLVKLKEKAMPTAQQVRTPSYVK